MLDPVTVPRLVVAGISGGSGKTTIALGLIAALRARGRSVQPFKVGPDLIDCAYLAHAARRPCRNLDSWLLGEDGVHRSLARGALGADCAVIEGVGGLFDGHGRAQSHASAGTGNGTSHRVFPGSTAEVARISGAPVVLVLDVGTTRETAAAIALGMRQMDPSLDIAGVILDSVPPGERQSVVEDAIWEHAKLPVLGALPHIEEVQIPELRSGLLPVTENPHIDRALDRLAEAISRHCDLDLIERVMRRARPLQAAPHPVVTAAPAKPLRVGVAFDDAFWFYYAENLESLEEAGAEVVTFSPLDDRSLPRDLDAIYLGGGVSEAYVPRLASNHAFIESLRRAHGQRVPIYAESGGLLYCARSARLPDGSTHELCGLIPVDVAIEQGLPHSGYRELELMDDCLLGPRGTRLRGHEFHFIRVLGGGGAYKPAYAVHDCDGEPLGSDGCASPTLLASLVHVHFGHDAALVNRLLDAARTRRLQTA